MHWSNRFFIAALFIFLTSVWYNQAKASEQPKFFVDLNVTSYHSEEGYYTEETRTYTHPHFWKDEMVTEEYTEVVFTPFNQHNTGLGIRYEIHENLDIGVGFYDNSYYKTSVYAGLEAHTKRSRWVSVGVVAGLVSGYTDTPAGSMLIILPMVQLGPPQVGVRVGYMPVGEVKFGTMQVYMGF